MKELSWEFTANSDADMRELHRLLDEFYQKHRYVNCEFTAGKQRTDTQNRSLHKWFDQLADALNGAGLDMRQVMKKDADLPWSKYTVKEFLWRPVYKALAGKESSKDADRTEYGYVEQVLAEHLQTKFPGLEVPPWPTERTKELENAQ